jgi:hypothetical protein
LDYRNRKVYFWVGIIGIVLGLPTTVLKSFLTNAANTEWLLRNDLFLPIPRLSEILLPKLAIFLTGVTFLWVMFQRKELIHLSALGVAALALENHQILTGLQMQNFHWTYCWGPITTLLFALMVVDLAALLVAWRRALVGGGIALTLLYLVSGLWFRSLEALRTKEPIELTTNYHKYVDQRFKHAVTPLEPRAVIAGSKEFIDYALILENQRPLFAYAVDWSPSVTDSEWEQRETLNAYLHGVDRQSFRDKLRANLNNRHFGIWARDSGKLSETIRVRERYLEAITSDPVAAFNRFQVRYVALPPQARRPKYLNTEWRLFQDGPHWQIWEFPGTINQNQ